MIAILGYSKLDMEVSDAVVKSNNYREVSKDNRDANGMLATI